MPDQPALRHIHVVAGVITDSRGRYLLNRREGNRDLVGLWEFPGGKREAGETSEQALVRELREELGVQVSVGECIIQVPQRYPDKTLVLEVRHITAVQGRPRGHEGQAITWVAPEKLHRYSMPPADLPVVAALSQADHYLVTPALGDDVPAWLAALEQAIEGGVQRVQLRLPAADPRREDALRQAVARFGQRAELLIHRDLALASELGVGLHLGSGQLAELGQRPQLAGPLAASCYSLEQLQAAQALGCDFAVLGPLRPTASRPGSPLLGWDGFAALRAQCSLPIYARGGLGRADLGIARDHGAQGIAAMAGLWPGRVVHQ
ncbi:DNA mismatch repair protein MutT [Stenotrophomonas ginsengisoli]|uniref:8-oxo-dGTP diphosphatase n=1 Tax=Stenotrophomonas ginsengisoli TaxID=336566 RepID=A0A0R0DDL0_9GAMM|nr:Nudix family hydrolase [Stenotrophomonas ginsengisoli]KRG75969.1 DNA mismatch repair protein MutT [Stenotrophomonas ginsengisoli]